MYFSPSVSAHPHSPPFRLGPPISFPPSLPPRKPTLAWLSLSKRVVRRLNVTRGSKCVHLLDTIETLYPDTRWLLRVYTSNLPNRVFLLLPTRPPFLQSFLPLCPVLHCSLHVVLPPPSTLLRFHQTITLQDSRGNFIVEWILIDWEWKDMEGREFVTEKKGEIIMEKGKTNLWHKMRQRNYRGFGE